MTFSSRHVRRAFTLLEVLIAIAILGVGLMMVATIFPVAATWSRQSTEETIANQVALNAYHLMKLKLPQIGFNWDPSTRYQIDSMVLCNGNLYRATAQNCGATQKPPAGNWDILDYSSVKKNPTIAAMRAPLKDTWLASHTYQQGDNVIVAGNQYEANAASFGVAPPNITYWKLIGPAGISASPYVFPLGERVYAFGADQPFPVPVDAAAKNAAYSWTALFRVVGDSEVIVSIFVFRKADLEHTWGQQPAGWVAKEEIAGARLPGEDFLPALVLQSYDRDADSFDSQNRLACNPPLGFTGIGASSGIVFKQGLTADSFCASPTVFLQGQTSNQNSDAVSAISEKIIYAPAPDHAAGSPLITIFQARLAF